MVLLYYSLLMAFGIRLKGYKDNGIGAHELLLQETPQKPINLQAKSLLESCCLSGAFASWHQSMLQLNVCLHA